MSPWLLKGRKQKQEARCLIRLGLEKGLLEAGGRSLHDTQSWRFPGIGTALGFFFMPFSASHVHREGCEVRLVEVPAQRSDRQGWLQSREK